MKPIHLIASIALGLSGFAIAAECVTACPRQGDIQARYALGQRSPVDHAIAHAP